MDAGLIGRIESGAERGAAVLFTAAVSYAGYGLAVALGAEPRLALCAAGAGVLAYLPCIRLLGIAGDRREQFDLPHFVLPAVDFVEAPEELLLTERVPKSDELLLTDALGPDELILTDDQSAAAQASPDQAPLELDDILDQIGPEARVVRLFDRKAMPAPRFSPGQLHTHLVDHSRNGASLSAPPQSPGPPDASQALSAALAELRRSLR
jgi:hypothetical protein